MKNSKPMRIASLADVAAALSLFSFARLQAWQELRQTELLDRVAFQRKGLSNQRFSADCLLDDVRRLQGTERELEAVREILLRIKLIESVAATVGFVTDEEKLRQLMLWVPEYWYECLQYSETALARAQALRSVLWDLASHCAKTSFEESQAAAPAGGEVVS